MLRARALLALLIVPGLSAAALAHEPGLSALEVRVARTHLVVNLSLAAPDAREAARRDQAVGVDVFALRGISLACEGGRLLPATVEAVTHDDAGGVRVRLRAERPAVDRLVVRSVIPRRLARGHRQLLSIRAADGALIAEQMLDAESGEAAVDLGTNDAARSAASFFLLGAAHILQGYDHLLFLAGLIVVIGRISEAAKVITAFTIAHALTLVMTTVGWMALSSTVTELLIASSIVYVGAENLLRSDVTRRWRLTFAFGLVHGLGFAGALGELAVGQNGEAIGVPLASFNLGVEASQLAVAAGLVPLVSRLRAHPTIGARVVTVSSAVILIAGIYWLIERAGAFA
jgi:hypothetical protein